MNIREASSVKPYTLDCYNAIKTIAGERECEICQGKGRVASGTALFKDCRKCNGTGKVKGEWKWEPERGEFALRQPLSEVDLITRILSHGILRLSSEEGCTFDEPAHKFIPILHWERIEEILEGMDYGIEFDPDHRGCTLTGGNGIQVYKKAKSRQQAIMQSVIALGKELKNVTLKR